MTSNSSLEKKAAEVIVAVALMKNSAANGTTPGCTCNALVGGIKKHAPKINHVLTYPGWDHGEGGPDGAQRCQGRRGTRSEERAEEEEGGQGPLLSGRRERSYAASWRK